MLFDDMCNEGRSSAPRIISDEGIDSALVSDTQEAAKGGSDAEFSRPFEHSQAGEIPQTDEFSHPIVTNADEDEQNSEEAQAEEEQSSAEQEFFVEEQPVEEAVEEQAIDFGDGDEEQVEETQVEGNQIAENHAEEIQVDDEHIEETQLEEIQVGEGQIEEQDDAVEQTFEQVDDEQAGEGYAKGEPDEIVGEEATQEEAEERNIEELAEENVEHIEKIYDDVNDVNIIEEIVEQPSDDVDKSVDVIEPVEIVDEATKDEFEKIVEEEIVEEKIEGDEVFEKSELDADEKGDTTIIQEENDGRQEDEIVVDDKNEKSDDIAKEGVKRSKRRDKAVVLLNVDPNEDRKEAKRRRREKDVKFLSSSSKEVRDTGRKEEKYLAGAHAKHGLSSKEQEEDEESRQNSKLFGAASMAWTLLSSLYMIISTFVYVGKRWMRHEFFYVLAGVLVLYVCVFVGMLVFGLEDPSSGKKRAKIYKRLLGLFKTLVNITFLVLSAMNMAALVKADGAGIVKWLLFAFSFIFAVVQVAFKLMTFVLDIQKGAVGRRYDVRIVRYVNGKSKKKTIVDNYREKKYKK